MNEGNLPSLIEPGEVVTLTYEGEFPRFDRSLNENGVVPGWFINLKGWVIDEETIADLWAKIRKFLLRPHKVDAVALFRFNKRKKDTPEKMELLPDMALYEGHSKHGSEVYTSRLVNVLNAGALKLFAETLVVAQDHYKRGEKRNIADLIWSDEPHINTLARFAGLPEEELNRLAPRVRRYEQKKAQKPSNNRA